MILHKKSKSITETIAAFAEKTPDKQSIVWNRKNITYAQLNALINQTANALLSTVTYVESNEQHIVAILLDNSIELLQVFLASARIGWIAAILDPKWSSNDLNSILLDCKPKVLVTDQSNYHRLRTIPNDMNVIIVPDIVHDIVPDIETIAATEISADYSVNGIVSNPDHNTDHSTDHKNLASFHDWIKFASTNNPKVSVSDQDLFYMGYTSGTTGKPKGFVRTHESWIESFGVSDSMFKMDQSNHVLAPGPLVHSLSLYAAAHTLFMGGTFYFVKKFDAANILDLLAERPITHMYLVPTMFEGICKLALLKSEPFYRSGLKGIISSGDKWTPESKQKAGVLFPNADLVEFYGASELSFITVLDPAGNKQRPDSVGKPVKNLQISIRDMDGNEVKPGEVGQLFVKSKMVFAGYYHNPLETSQVLQNGWATVGDLVRQDEEGFVYIVGRKKNRIISGGLNIFPEEIERVLLKLPEIEEAVVVGIPDSYWGQKVVALIKCVSSPILNDHDIKTFCREHLASYKCPKEIIQVDSFPHTTSGKISRKEVNEQMLARM